MSDSWGPLNNLAHELKNRAAEDFAMWRHLMADGRASDAHSFGVRGSAYTYAADRITEILADEAAEVEDSEIEAYEQMTGRKLWEDDDVEA